MRTTGGYLLAGETTDRDLGPNDVDERARRHIAHRPVRRWEGLGYEAELTLLAAD